MTLRTDVPGATALEELGRLCAPYVGTLLANGDTERVVHLRSQLKAVSLELEEDDDSDPALHSRLDAANRQVEAGQGGSQFMRNIRQELAFCLISSLDIAVELFEFT